jgi:hypothetical protein
MSSKMMLSFDPSIARGEVTINVNFRLGLYSTTRNDTFPSFLRFASAVVPTATGPSDVSFALMMSESYFGPFDGSIMNFQTVSAGLSTTMLVSIFAMPVFFSLRKI